MDFRILLVFAPIFLALGWAGYNIGRAALGQIQLAIRSYKQNTSKYISILNWKAFLFSTAYISMCIGLFILARHESTIQPVGLLVVAMVFTPLIISIVGGLRLDSLPLSKAKEGNLD